MIHVRKTPLDEIRVGDSTLIPIAARIAVRFPGGHGGLVWARPVALTVRSRGEVRWISISDPTRIAQWALFGAGLAAVALAGFVRFRRRGRGGSAGWR